MSIYRLLFAQTAITETLSDMDAEIRAVEEGRLHREDNPLKHAPHTAAMLVAVEWKHAYTRELAAYPVTSLRAHKYWPPVGRADNVYGDRNLFCGCIPPSA